MNMTREPLPVPSSRTRVAPARGIPGWVVALVGVGALLTAAGAVIALADPAMLLGPHEQVSDAVRVYADYLFARNFALSATLIVTLLIGARRPLAGLMTLTAVIQASDLAVDAATGRWMLAPGLLVFTAAFLLGAHRLVDHPLWRTATWREQ